MPQTPFFLREIVLPVMLARLGRLVLDAVLPPLCLKCQAIVAEPGTLCPQCWQQITFLAPPFCVRCGRPFEFDPGPAACCGACLRTPPVYDCARAVLRYDEASRPLILSFKHGDRLEGTAAFAHWMARAGADLLDKADLLVPVPLHRWRLARRRYNQAALLALALGRRCGIAVAPDLLRRRRSTPSQGHLGPEARRQNVAGAFTLARNGASGLAGQRVVLIDDVLTTGATVEECARVLRRSGAAEIGILTLARVLRET